MEEELKDKVELAEEDEIVEPNPSRPQQSSVQLPRSDRLYNEFIENGNLLMKSFLHLFIRGSRNKILERFFDFATHETSSPAIRWALRERFEIYFHVIQSKTTPMLFVVK